MNRVLSSHRSPDESGTIQSVRQDGQPTGEYVAALREQAGNGPLFLPGSHSRIHPLDPWPDPRPLAGPGPPTIASMPTTCGQLSLRHSASGLVCRERERESLLEVLKAGATDPVMSGPGMVCPSATTMRPCEGGRRAWRPTSP